MTDIRLSPSGPVIASFGRGMRLRLTEEQATMAPGEGVDLVIPSTTTGVINHDGFGGESPVTVELLLPKPNLSYRATLRLDVWNFTTNISGQLVLWIDATVDGGLNWQPVAKNGHQIQPQIGADAARDGANMPLTCQLTNTDGSTFGVVAGTAALRLRGRVKCLTDATCAVDSSNVVAGETGLGGTIYLLLEESTG